MEIEQTVKQIIGEIKKIDPTELKFAHNTNFIETINLDSFEVVSLVDKLDTTFKIDFGTEPADFDSLKSWSALLDNLTHKINLKK
ncbi:MAG: acyl carrier protein [Gammaproteobacteria bacterium]